MNKLRLVKVLLGLMLAVQHLWVHSQAVTIQPVLPGVGMLQAAQLWNISAINTQTGTQAIKIGLQVIDRVTGAELTKAESGTVVLNPGVTLLSERQMGGIAYLPSGFFSTISGRMFLPVGQYTLCYTLWVEVNKNMTPGGRECYPIDTEGLTPPFLNFPFDQMVLSEKNPRFVWIPPSPAQLFSALRYDFLLVERQPGQTPEEAIQRNTPLMAIGNLTTNSFGYNGTGISALDTGRQYAWQVTARNAEAYGGKSEVWSFRVEGETVSHKGESDYYLTLGSSNERLPVFYSSQDQLNVRYINNYIQGRNFNVIISDNNGKVVLNKKIKIFPGDNFFSIKLTGKFLENIIYNVRLESESAPIAYGQLIKVKNN